MEFGDGLFREALGALLAQQDLQRLQDDLEIQQQAEVGDVDHVHLQLVQRRGVVFAVDLGVARQAAARLAAEDELRDLLGVLLHVLPALRAGADDAHVALEDVDQLRQLVNAGGADDLADSGDAGVVLAGGAGAPVLLRIHDHGAELDHHEAPAADGAALLFVEHRAAVVQPDGQGRDQQDRGQDDQRQRAQHYVEKSLDPSPEQQGAAVAAQEQGRVEQVDLVRPAHDDV